MKFSSFVEEEEPSSVNPSYDPFAFHNYNTNKPTEKTPTAKTPTKPEKIPTEVIQPEKTPTVEIQPEKMPRINSPSPTGVSDISPDTTEREMTTQEPDTEKPGKDNESLIHIDFLFNTNNNTYSQT